MSVNPRHKQIRHVFVDSFPDRLEEGILYVSIKYATTSHKCCCGCGNLVVAPLSPNDWELTFDGETVSLNPSIGNWSFPCKSHYWIKRNKIIWSRKWSHREIKVLRGKQKQETELYYKGHTKIAEPYQEKDSDIK